MHTGWSGCQILGSAEMKKTSEIYNMCIKSVKPFLLLYNFYFHKVGRYHVHEQYISQKLQVKKINYYNYGPQKVDNFTKSRQRSARQILEWTSHVIISLWKSYKEKWQRCILCSNAPIQGLNIISQNCCHMAIMGTDVIKITYCDSL